SAAQITGVFIVEGRGEVSSGARGRMLNFRWKEIFWIVFLHRTQIFAVSGAIVEPHIASQPLFAVSCSGEALPNGAICQRYRKSVLHGRASVSEIQARKSDVRRTPDRRLCCATHINRRQNQFGVSMREQEVHSGITPAIRLSRQLDELLR